MAREKKFAKSVKLRKYLSYCIQMERKSSYCKQVTALNYLIQFPLTHVPIPNSPNRNYPA